MPGIVSPDDAHNVDWGFCEGLKLREGLYKANFHTVHGTGCGVLYVTDGKLRGGNSAFAFVGTYTGKGESIKVKISTERYNDDPTFRPLFGTDRITLNGREDGEMAEFEGSALQLPGVAFLAVLTRISD
ncbi:GrlR family regulatory protein [Bradyrhizobium sp. UFLA05-109]